MSIPAVWLSLLLIIGLGAAADVPFVFDGNAFGVAGYSPDQIEQASASSSDLNGVPFVSSLSDNETLEFPVTGGGSAPGSVTEKKVGDLKATLDARVEPGESRVREEATVLALKHPGDLTIDQIASIYSYLKNGDGIKKGWGYVRDPRGIDDFGFANKTLIIGDRANCVGGGDCDDFAILMSALIESIGGTTRIILARNNTQGGHAYAEVYLGNLNEPIDQVEGIINWLKPEFDTNKIFTHIDTDTKDIWLNLDWGPDEKGNTHPGGPFFQGDKHIVLNIQDKYEKTPLKLSVKSNGPPKLISLTSDKPSPQEGGTTITWTAEAEDTENDQVFYRFFLNNKPVTNWIADDIWTWTTTDADLGKSIVKAQVRDSKHADQEGLDDSKSEAFVITRQTLIRNDDNTRDILLPIEDVSDKDILLDISELATEHIQGSIAIPYTNFLINGTYLRSEADMTKLMGDAGISRDDPVVIYGECIPCGGGPEPATFVYWIMRSLGQENVRVLDGTVKDWASAGKPMATETTILPAKVYTPHANPDFSADYSFVISGSVQIVDARSMEDFGEGSIPGAINIPYENVIIDGKIEDETKLDRVFAILDKNQPVVVYTNTGVKASAVWFALTLLGYDAKLYSYVNYWDNQIASGKTDETNSVT
jgi:3-mercaptopyruvate sulfurtransferase SseA